MQSLLVQLLQQLHGTRTTDNQRLQWLLITGSCKCLQGLPLQSGAKQQRKFLLRCFVQTYPFVVAEQVVRLPAVCGLTIHSCN